MMRYPEECGKQQRPKQGNLDYKNKKKRRRKRDRERNEKRRSKKRRKEEEEKTKRKRIMEIKKVVEEQEIWDEEVEVAKFEEEAKKLVPQRFHKWIYVFEEKASERMPMKKVWDYMIEVKKEFVPRKRKMYPLSKEERGEVCKFIEEQLRKGYIRLSKLPQMTPVFFIGKKDSKKCMVQDYRY